MFFDDYDLLEIFLKGINPHKLTGLDPDDLAVHGYKAIADELGLIYSDELIAQFKPSIVEGMEKLQKLIE